MVPVSTACPICSKWRGTRKVMGVLVCGGCEPTARERLSLTARLGRAVAERNKSAYREARALLRGAVCRAQGAGWRWGEA